MQASLLLFAQHSWNAFLLMLQSNMQSGDPEPDCAAPPDTALPPASLQPEDDEALARRAPRNSQAFAELYRRHMPRIYHFHLARTGNVDEAEDLTSLTFLAALENIERYGGRGSFCGWLFGIAHHKLADHYRRQHPADQLDMAETMSHPDPAPDDIVTRRLQLDKIAHALKNLPPEQSEALTLRIFGELSAAEAGQVMDKSEAAVKMLVHRGMRTLQTRLAPAVEVAA